MQDFKNLDVYNHGDHYKIVDKNEKGATPCVITWKDGERYDLNGFQLYCWDDTIDVAEYCNNFSDNYSFYESKKELWDDIMQRYDNRQDTFDALNAVDLGDWDDEIGDDNMIIYDSSRDDYEVASKKTDEFYYDNTHYKVVYVVESTDDDANE